MENVVGSAAAVEVEGTTGTDPDILRNVADRPHMITGYPCAAQGAASVFDPVV
jgi:hypothetical protein